MRGILQAVWKSLEPGAAETGKKLATAVMDKIPTFELRRRRLQDKMLAKNEVTALQSTDVLDKTYCSAGCSQHNHMNQPLLPQSMNCSCDCCRLAVD